MSPIEYKFEQIPLIKNDSYILQIVMNRKLSAVYHFHDFYEIILILRGEATHQINQHNYKMGSGDCVILLPGDAHRFLSQSEDIELLGFSITTREFQRFCDSFEAKLPQKSGVDGAACIFSCSSRLSEIRSFSQKGYYYNNILDHRLLLCTVLSAYCAHQEVSNDMIPAALQNALNQMQDPEYIKEGMAAMLKLTNYSRSHLCRLMKQHYHTTPHDFINKLRLKTAYNMLLFSDQSIDEIADRVGYNSVSHFNIIFKQEYGLSPAILRKSNRLPHSF